MNPIHEAGFASLVVLFFGATPGALASVLALLLAKWKPKAALTLAHTASALSALILLLAAITTLKLHNKIEYWINTGGYGPPEDIQRLYAPEWHASARLTAMAGIAFTAIPLLLAFAGHQKASSTEKWTTTAKTIATLVTLTWAFCFLLCFL